jgi:L-ascorbate metabolism protein UlaG (beta-lactamase superfamily)
VSEAAVTYVGHATALIELGGRRVLTDPLLRKRLGHLQRHGTPPNPAVCRDLDAVLISHLHLDHLDPPSLQRIDHHTELIVPAGARNVLRRQGFQRVYEVAAGDEIRIRAVRIVATHAEHDRRRRPSRMGGPEADTLGFIIEGGGLRVYFAGDTDAFPEMEEQIGQVDVALLPVWGWGPSLGEGHLDPHAAAEVAARLRPRVAIPIHWGTFFPIGLKRVRPDRLTDPPHEFGRYVGELAPDVEVRVLEPGESTNL